MGRGWLLSQSPPLASCLFLGRFLFRSAFPAALLTSPLIVCIHAERHLSRLERRLGRYPLRNLQFRMMHFPTGKFIDKSETSAASETAVLMKAGDTKVLHCLSRSYRSREGQYLCARRSVCRKIREMEGGEEPISGHLSSLPFPPLLSVYLIRVQSYTLFLLRPLLFAFPLTFLT